VLPLPFTALWGLWLRHAGKSAMPASVVAVAALPAIQSEARRKPGWTNETRFNLSPAKSAF
jgi:hypothetical protein